MEEKKNIPVQASISEEELEGVSGGAKYSPGGRMITTHLNSCSEWKCPTCGTYSGANCPDHPREGKRWCKDCKYVDKNLATLHCNFWRG